MAPNKNKQKQKQLAAKKKAYNNRNSNNKTTWIAIGVIAVIVIVFAAVAASGIMGNHGAASPSPSPTAVPTPSPTPINASSDPYANATEVLLQTSMGNITLALRNDMPLTTGNFINLVNQGAYNGTTFHRVIKDFMIQSGQLANGSEAPSIQDEFTTTNHNYNGTIAMAKLGNSDGSAVPNSATSQFFINTADNNNRYSFDSSYVAFGKVISGMDVAMAISQVPTDSSDAPTSTVTIIGASVLP
jgi:Peptidyl-prolyl cis-trans isomerase (rotamase) - cyclophilin family